MRSRGRRSPRSTTAIAPNTPKIAHFTRHRQPFNRLTLWHHNFLPIQTVLFHRDLYARYGGFAEDMDQLEDWNLWTRYTLEDDFVLVEKTTSKYRVPAGARDAAGRQERLDRAYQDAVNRQREFRVTLSPRQISQMAEDYARSQSLVMVSRSDVRQFVVARPGSRESPRGGIRSQGGSGGAS